MAIVGTGQWTIIADVCEMLVGDGEHSIFLEFWDCVDWLTQSFIYSNFDLRAQTTKYQILDKQ